MKLLKKREAELRIQFQREENQKLARDRATRIRELNEAKAKAAELAATPAASALPQASFEQMQAQIAALTQV